MTMKAIIAGLEESINSLTHVEQIISSLDEEVDKLRELPAPVEPPVPQHLELWIEDIEALMVSGLRSEVASSLYETVQFLKRFRA